ncbi:DUF2290 domain-containing protein [Hymenobacter rigui]|uniref:DUF2290 domain-containing protein n=1 Tax=Hymenobacter rigui TaxID=334424 RepID=A0A428KWP7_9BACT|nr:DUF2290 domain-containing protein [Hymenobacter rigui]RSK51145.1 DUF2290 domain-containing protein [Hymenobacter rigui]
MIPINNVFENLDATYKAFKDFIIDRNYSEQNNEICWPSYKSGISKQVYSKQYEDLIANRQFTFLLTDRSAVQIYYSYDNTGLKKIRLAYYPAPKTINIEREDIDTYYGETFSEALEAHYMLLHDLMGQGISVSNTTHVRFDYDRDVTSHNTNHLQIDGIQELRIPFKHIILPFHFVDFIIQNTYSDEYFKINKSPNIVYLLASSNKNLTDVDIGHDYYSIFMSM